MTFPVGRDARAEGLRFSSLSPPPGMAREAVAVAVSGSHEGGRRVDVDQVLPSVPRDQYGTLARVENPPLRGAWLRARMGFLSTLSGVLRRQEGFSDAKVFNFEHLLSADGRFALDRHPVVFVLGGHVENPGDSLLLFSKWKDSPWIGRGSKARYFVPHFIKRLDEDMGEKVAHALFPELVCQVDTGGSKDEPLEVHEARKARNEAAVKALAKDVLGRAEQQVIYAEGTCTGNGRIYVRKTGGVESFARFEEKPVALALATHTYEPLTGSRTQPFINCRKDIVRVADGADRDALARALEVELSRLNVLTTTGITGAYLLRARDEGTRVFSLATMRRVVTDVVQRARAAKATGALDLEIDPALLAPSTREQAIRTAFDKLLTTRFDRKKDATYLVPDAETKTYRLSDALGETAHQILPPPETSTFLPKLERRDPLGYWGNRLRQHMESEPVLARIGEEVFSEALAPGLKALLHP